MSNGNQSKYSESSDFALWDAYEKVAMHFNDLIMRLRTQTLGALAGVVAISGLAINFAQKSESRSPWATLCAALGFFTIAWIALWVLDMFYYDKLLRGAVAAIMKKEKETLDQPGRIPISLSTQISNAVPFHYWTIHIFYLIVFIGLALGVWFAYWQYLRWENPPRDIPEYRIQLTQPERMKELVEPAMPKAAPK